MKIGETVKKLRRSLGLSQIQLCKRVGITQATLSQIENDQTFPQKQTLNMICKELNVSEDLLFMLSLSGEDLSTEKKKLFDNIRNLMIQIYYEDDNAPISL